MSFTSEIHFPTADSGAHLCNEAVQLLVIPVQMAGCCKWRNSGYIPSERMPPWRADA